MNNKVLFVNTGHFSLDDRTFYHQAMSLVKNGYNVEVISSKEKLITEIDQIKINSFDDSQLGRKDKLVELTKRIEASKPDLIIADTPLAVFAAARYRNKKSTRIIYDITEWYPSKKNFLYNNGLTKYLKFVSLAFINYLSGWKSGYFIFGEHFKALPFEVLFFWKKKIYLPYYPNIDYIFQHPIEDTKNGFNITYSGAINSDKGIVSTIDSVILAGKKSPDKTFNLRIIGKFFSQADKDQFQKIISAIPSNVKIVVYPNQSFPDYCKIIGNAHLFLDLRKKDFENNRCLPIKLFYYLACGRPVIYSDLRSIEKEISTINFGYLCDPNDIETISNHIIEYANNQDLYSSHCSNALKVSKDKYNWKSIETGFLKLVKTALNK